MTSTIEMKKLSSNNIVSPKGFTAAGVHCGIKHKKKDLAILVSEVPASCSRCIYNKCSASSTIKSNKRSCV